MIVIVDYDMGNIGSIVNMLHHIGSEEVTVSNNADDIFKADRIILPGVGAYDQGMLKLKQYGLIDILKKKAEKGAAFLGICLGMQLLGLSSEEGVEKGFGLIPFRCRKFEASQERKVPHMGWRDVSINHIDDPLFSGMNDKDQRFYFVHSYYAECDHSEDVLMKCDYSGQSFSAAVVKGRIYGVQFHPEKSHKFGMRLLENFIRI